MRSLASLVLVIGCATAAPAPQALKPLPRSSVAALIGHTGELELDPKQVAELTAIDDQLERDCALLRERLQTIVDKQPRYADDDRLTGGASQRGSGYSGRPGPPPPGKEPDIAGALLQALDDKDTQAYLQAEEALSEPQREKARAIAGKYREDLWDQREQQQRRRRR